MQNDLPPVAAGQGHGLSRFGQRELKNAANTQSTTAGTPFDHKHKSDRRNIDRR